jgi:hypothetical protein
VHRILPTGRKAAWYASKLSETETDANQDRRAENGGLFVVLDIAHNEAALLALSDKIQKAFPGYEVRWVDRWLLVSKNFHIFHSDVILCVHLSLVTLFHFVTSCFIM